MELLNTQFGNLFQLPLKAVNWGADTYFYDVFSLKFPDEWRAVTPLSDLKGTIIVVSPHSENRGIRHYPNPRSFMRHEGKEISAIVVAGVGSSVLGTAALARNVSDYTGWDVAGVVTGYGLSDVAQEGLGGWCYYGGIDQLRYVVERALGRMFPLRLPARQPNVSDASPDGRERHFADSTPRTSRSIPGLGYPMSLDVLGNSDIRTLYDILVAGRDNYPKLQLLMGHSKGNLLISYALNHIKDELRETGDPVDPLIKELIVVTLGAVVDIPTAALERKDNTYQFLGQLDGLGHLNSDRDPPFIGPINIPHEVVPGVGHHLNPFFSLNMSVSEVLDRVGKVPARDNTKPKAAHGGVPIGWPLVEADFPWYLNFRMNPFAIDQGARK